MTKTYVLDTNVLLHNPEALFSFQENQVVIPFAVIEEIDNQKKRQDEIGRNARTASRILDGMRSSGRLELPRNAERHAHGRSPRHPPRSTRYSPVVGPVGSDSGES